MVDTGSRSLDLWRTAMLDLPDRVAATLNTAPKITGGGLRAHSRVITTGLGSSTAHARLLAYLLSEVAGVSASCVPVAALQGRPRRGWSESLLVVFSQAISANTRFALHQPGAFAQSMIVTSAAGPESSARSERDDFVGGLWSRNVLHVNLCEDLEFGALVRVAGPMLGYATAWQLARLIAGGRKLERDAPADGGNVRDAMKKANERVDAAFPTGPPMAPFLAGKPVHVLSSGGYEDLCGNFALKLLEGFRVEGAPVCDLLQFSHGPFQALYENEASLLFLARSSSPGEARAIERLRSMLVPGRHDLRVLDATLSGPATVFEHEATLNELMVRWHEEASIDPTTWPGQGQDAPLYEWAPAGFSDEPPIPVARSKDAQETPSDFRIDRLTSPEVEGERLRGRRTVIVPLGSTEQHGPHLGLSTDTVIADALAARLCERVGDALALSALPLGCASEHMDFPGTLSLGEETLHAILSDVLRSLSAHGFDRAFVFSAHGGNAAALREFAERHASNDLGIVLDCVSDLGLVSRLQGEVAARYGVAAEIAGQHAGEFETSVVAAIAPDLLREEQRAPGLVATPTPGQSIFYPSLRRHAENGVVGDPSHSDPSRSDAYLDAWVDGLERIYRAGVAREAGLAKKRK